MTQPYIGQITMFAGNFAPRGWHFCDGTLLPIQQFTPLFSIIGTFYGGDGIQNFALPDLRSRVPLQSGQGPGLTPYDLGEQTGAESITLLTTQMPQHNHPLNALTATATSPTPTGNLLTNAVAGGRPENFYAAGNPTTQMSNQAIGVAGGGQPHANIQPVLALNFIIALEGIFPSRN